MLLNLRINSEETRAAGLFGHVAELQLVLMSFFSIRSAKGHSAYVAYRNAMLQQAVFPDRNTLISWLKRWPGLGHSAGVMKAIRYLSGQEESLAGKG